MAFVDGENLTIRGQQFAKRLGIELRDGEWWKENVYLWLPQPEGIRPLGPLLAGASPADVPLEPRPTRAHYYTSLRGDDPKVNATRDALRHLHFHPSVFKKDGDRSKGVDITLARDVLSHAYLNNYDLALLVAGDGDYLPLVEEVQHRGCIVVVAFFEEWTNPDLRRSADAFYNLSPLFERDWKVFLSKGE